MSPENWKFEISENGVVRRIQNSFQNMLDFEKLFDIHNVLLGECFNAFIIESVSRTLNCFQIRKFGTNFWAQYSGGFR